MPAHINYETTPILFYKFVCENPEIKSCYVGHTTNIIRRKNSHKFRCYNNKSKDYELKIYQIIRENGGFDNWKIVEIDRRICLDNSDACKIEQKYIEELQSDMNSHFASRTIHQYYLDNKEQITEKQKIYNLHNKEKIAEYQKNYRLENKERIAEKKNKQKYDCECGGKYIHEHKSHHLKTLKHLKYCETIASK